MLTNYRLPDSFNAETGQRRTFKIRAGTYSGFDFKGLIHGCKPAIRVARDNFVYNNLLHRLIQAAVRTSEVLQPLSHLRGDLA